MRSNLSWNDYVRIMFGASLFSGTLMVLTFLSATLHPPSQRGRLRIDPVTIAVCDVNDALDSVIVPEGYDVIYASTCDEAYLYGADWVIQCFGTCSEIDLSFNGPKNWLVDGFCGMDWGVATPPNRVECPTASPTPAPTEKSLNETAGIDIVFLWVNGSDPTRVAALAQYRHEAKLDEAATPNRFREWNELYYAVKLVQKHAIHLGRIFIVTSGERPYYHEELGDVQWVVHEDFIPPAALPTFSSSSIQISLFYLKDVVHLSDPFVQFDDDIFVTRTYDLAQYAHSKVWYGESWGQDWGMQPKSNNQFVRSIQFANQELKKVLPQHVPQNCLGHVPVVVRHKTLNWLWENMHNAAHTTLSRFRSPESLMFQYTLSNIERALLPGVKFRRAREFSTFIMMGDNHLRLKQEFTKALRTRTLFICVNDDIKNPTSEHKQLFKTFGDQLLSLE